MPERTPSQDASQASCCTRCWKTLWCIEDRKCDYVRAMNLVIIFVTVAFGFLEVVTNELRWHVGRTPPSQAHPEGELVSGWILNSRGIGYAVFFTWTLLRPVLYFFKLMDPDPSHELGDRFNWTKIFPPNLVPGTSTEPQYLFTIDGCRWTRFTWKVTRVLFNSSMILVRFIDAEWAWRTKALSLGEPLIRTKHIIAWCELYGLLEIIAMGFGVLGIYAPSKFTFVQLLSTVALLESLAGYVYAREFFSQGDSSNTFLYVFIIYLFWLFGVHGAGRKRTEWATIGNMIDASARYSILNSLHYVSIDVLNREFGRLTDVACKKIMIMVFTVPFPILAGFGSLAVKVASLAFLGNKKYWDWELKEWLNLLSFTNNLVGIMDLASSVRLGIFEGILAEHEKTDTSGHNGKSCRCCFGSQASHGSNESESQETRPKKETAMMVHEGWMKAFGNELCRDVRPRERGLAHGPFKGMVIYLTVTPQEIAKCLRRQMKIEADKNSALIA